MIPQIDFKVVIADSAIADLKEIVEFAQAAGGSIFLTIKTAPAPLDREQLELA
jgi:hypothetical protein